MPVANNIATKTVGFHREPERKISFAIAYKAINKALNKDGWMERKRKTENEAQRKIKEIHGIHAAGERGR